YSCTLIIFVVLKSGFISSGGDLMADLITFKSKVISKLSRFKNKIYRKELGVILSYSLEDFNEDSFYLYDKKRYNKQVTFKKSDDMKEILSFFEKMGKYSISFNTVEKWLSEGSDCWLIYYNDIVIGGTWVLKGEVTITQLTEHWLSKNKKVIFDRDSVYRGYTIIDDNYRGQGIYQSFNHCLLKHYYDKE